jgi:hypothetical protein
LQYGRSDAAIGCLYVLIHSKVDFSPELAVRALGQSLSEHPAALDQNMIIELVHWLQRNPATKRGDLFHIEWQYLPLLRSPYSEEGPKVLDERLASDPTFFSEVIAAVFRSDKSTTPKESVTEAEANIGRNAYQLLHGWKLVPGTTSTGTFDGVAFSNWIKDVKRLTTESGHFRVAMSQAGEVLPYAPPDPDGLWIHRTVAAELDAKDGKELRSGFTVGLFNRRGIHGFSKGAEEQQLANEYEQKAEILEKNGFPRIAGAVRGVAEDYERDAKREAQRDPFER